MDVKQKVYWIEKKVKTVLVKLKAANHREIVSVIDISYYYSQKIEYNHSFNEIKIIVEKQKLSFFKMASAIKPQRKGITKVLI